MSGPDLEPCVHCGETEQDPCGYGADAIMYCCACDWPCCQKCGSADINDHGVGVIACHECPEEVA